MNRIYCFWGGGEEIQSKRTEKRKNKTEKMAGNALVHYTELEAAGSALSIHKEKLLTVGVRSTRSNSVHSANNLLRSVSD